jgi:ketosteroid isomerase-like protein
MSTPRFLTFLLTALLPLSAFAQGSTATAPDAAELTTLLKDFLAGASRNDVAMHERFWADDLIYTGSSGRRLGKAELMRDVRQEAAPTDGQKEDAETATFTAEDIRIQQYGTTAIVAFRLVGTTKKGDNAEVANYLNSGTFLKRDGKWQVVNWQATKMPAESPSEK